MGEGRKDRTKQLELRVPGQGGGGPQIWGLSAVLAELLLGPGAAQRVKVFGIVYEILLGVSNPCSESLDSSAGSGSLIKKRNKKQKQNKKNNKPASVFERLIPTCMAAHTHTGRERKISGASFADSLHK